MTPRHYDVVILGRSLGALATAALLSRRDFRVLVVGQGARPPSYRLEHHVFRRSAFTLLAGTSPVWRRILAELSQTQGFRRRMQPLDPIASLLLPDRRMELPADPELFSREIDRELPEVRRSLDELHAKLSHLRAAADQAFERDATLPPGTFWERREAARIASSLPYVKGEAALDLFADFPVRHAFPALLRTLSRFSSDMVGHLPPFALGRLYASWLLGPSLFPRGEDELDELLIERIQAHGGALRLEDRVERISLRGSAVSAVTIEGDLAPTGATFVVSDQTGAEILELSGDDASAARAPREWPRLERAAGRFVMSIVVRTQGLPAPLGREIFVLPSLDDRRPPLHLIRLDPAVEPDAPAEAAAESLLVAELLLPLTKPGPVSLGEAREYVLRTLGAHLPFLGRHLVAADSPHDGRPAWKWIDGQRIEIDRVQLRGASLRAEPMQSQYAMTTPGWLGCAGEPVRGPISRTFLTGSSVLPALGQEGQLLAAFSVARIITRADKHKERIRKAMWSRVEIG